jgi:hypothetical protein
VTAATWSTIAECGELCFSRRGFKTVWQSEAFPKGKLVDDLRSFRRSALV